MTMKASKATSESNENLVADYLSKHPDFFLDRDKLLLEMQLPHHQGGTISLIEKQVTLLRERNRDAKKELEQFVQAAKENDDIFKKSQKLILALVQAKNHDDFYGALEKSFRRDFKCTAYSLIAFKKESRQVNHFTNIVSESAAREYIGALIKRKKPTLGVLRPTEQDFLFRHQSAKVKSAAVLSIKREKKQIALLAIGSSKQDYFRGEMGTLFLGFIADTLALLLPQYLNQQY